jgi:dihydrodipicolinate synthase/N-acetylneuraminate lyase
VTHVVLAATLTPFKPDGSLWLKRIPPYLRFLADHGVDGYLALGTNGEFASLDVAERQAVLAAVVDAADGRRVIANVGSTVVSDVLALTRHAREVGADSVAVLPPYYFPITAQAYDDLVRGVADAFGRPVHLYNIPRYTGFVVPVDSVAHLSSEGIVAGLKDSSQDLDYLDTVRTAAPDIELLMGSDTTLIAGLEHGVSGVASGMANTFPDIAVGAVRAFEKGDDMTHWAETIQRVRRFFARYPYLAATRHAIAERGMDVGTVRPPLVDVSDDEARAARDAVAEILGSVGTVGA